MQECTVLSAVYNAALCNVVNPVHQYPRPRSQVRKNPRISKMVLNIRATMTMTPHHLQKTRGKPLLYKNKAQLENGGPEASKGHSK
jgi:hypothetical protein